MKSLLSLIYLFSLSLIADDWPGWLGPKRDGKWREDSVLKELPKSGLHQLWEVPVSKGYSGPAVSGNIVVVTDFKTEEKNDEIDIVGTKKATGGKERVRAFDLKGNLLWTHEYDEDYTIAYANGPRATPTIKDGMVYTLGAQGKLVALDLKTGKKKWGVDLVKKYKTKSPLWGYSHHPLVDDGKVYVVAGGAGSIAVALDKDSGEEVWRSLTNSNPDENQGYAPPTIIHHNGKKQILFWHGEALESVNPNSGEVNWSCPFNPAYSMAVSTPVIHDDLLYISSITNQAALLQLDGLKQPSEVWFANKARDAVYTTNSTPVMEDGVIYGIDSLKGMLVAVDAKTGKRLWQDLSVTTDKKGRKSYGTAFLVKNGDLFYIFNEAGELITAKLSKEGYEEKSRVKLIDPTSVAFGRKVVWSHPAFAKRSIFVRNDEKLVRYDLNANNYKKEGPKPGFSFKKLQSSALSLPKLLYKSKGPTKTLDQAADHVEFMTKMGTEMLDKFLKENPDKAASFTKNNIWSAISNKETIAKTWSAAGFLYDFRDEYLKSDENDEKTSAFVSRVENAYNGLIQKYEAVKLNKDLSKKEKEKKLWNLFGSIAALEYVFYERSETEIDLKKKFEKNGTLKLRDPNSKKTIHDYFSHFEEPNKAIVLAKKMAFLERELAGKVTNYETVKGMLPRFWAYHWEFHDLLLD